MEGTTTASVNESLTLEHVARAWNWLMRAGKTVQVKIGQRLYNCLNCRMQVVVPDYDERSELCGGCLRKTMLLENVGDEKAYKRDAIRRRRQRTQYEKRLRAVYSQLSTIDFAMSCNTFTFVNGYHGVAMSENVSKLSMGIVKVDSNKPDWDWEAMQQAKA